MKKGFALLETIVVITFLCVSLLMLYGTFSSMINNTKKNNDYDNASNIYKAYFLKEYLEKNNLFELLTEEDIQEITCEDFSFPSCSTLLKEMNIHKMYVTKYDLKNFNNGYSSMLNNYLASLSNKDSFDYRFVIELMEEETTAYASIGIKKIVGEENE